MKKMKSSSVPVRLLCCDDKLVVVIIIYNKKKNNIIIILYTILYLLYIPRFKQELCEGSVHSSCHSEQIQILAQQNSSFQ